MKVFLSSSPTGSLDGKYQVQGIDQNNQFRYLLYQYWKQNGKGLMITAFPENRQGSLEMTDFFFHAFNDSNLCLSCLDLLDYQNMDMSKEQLLSYDVIVLGGGHVPTQNKFFHELDLRNKLVGYEGIIIGISAGTMNSADEVYCQPEEMGEGSNPYFVKFLEGLNLTKINIIPHYQMIKDYWLDGKRLFEDITYQDSYGHYFYCLEDGSYLFNNDGKDYIYGKAYVIHDGQISMICNNNQFIEL